MTVHFDTIGAVFPPKGKEFQAPVGSQTRIFNDSLSGTGPLSARWGQAWAYTEHVNLSLNPFRVPAGGAEFQARPPYEELEEPGNPYQVSTICWPWVLAWMTQSRQHQSSQLGALDLAERGSATAIAVMSLKFGVKSAEYGCYALQNTPTALTLQRWEWGTTIGNATARPPQQQLQYFNLMPPWPPLGNNSRIMLNCENLGTEWSLQVWSAENYYPAIPENPANWQFRGSIVDNHFEAGMPAFSVQNFGSREPIEVIDFFGAALMESEIRRP